MNLVTHSHLDLDALACLTVLLREHPEATLHFWPSNWEPAPGSRCPCGCGMPVNKDWRIVDHPAGEKGRLDADGTRHAALVALPEAQGWNPDLLAEVDEQDSTGLVRQPRFSLGAIVAAVRRYMDDQNIPVRSRDREMLTILRPVLDGLNLLFQDRKACESMQVPYLQLETGEKIALLPPGPTPPTLGIVLNERGYSGAIFQDGLNLGVTRYPGRDTPDLRLLEPFLPGWFIHPSGFLASWGSRKAPAQTLPPEGTPQTQGELAQLLLQLDWKNGQLMGSPRGVIRSPFPQKEQCV